MNRKRVRYNGENNGLDVGHIKEPNSTESVGEGVVGDRAMHDGWVKETSRRELLGGELAFWRLCFTCI